ncbi:MAG: phosphatidylinositol-specific phospholipase C domain-containing protein [Myxococcota bacterium]|nr:phosphatidylinositol-specific phospholipase C domain-containing protein [Myxococcota bacterium]
MPLIESHYRVILVTYIRKQGFCDGALNDGYLKKKLAPYVPMKTTFKWVVGLSTLGFWSLACLNATAGRTDIGHHDFLVHRSLIGYLTALNELGASSMSIITDTLGRIGLFVLSVGLLSLTAACGGSNLCNGYERLCDLKLNEVTFPATHNSHASEELEYNEVAMTQFDAMDKQLAAGIRALGIDVYFDDSGSKIPLLCHGGCKLGSQPLVDGLRSITDFIEANEREVLVLLVQNEIPDTALVDFLSQNEISEYFYTHPAGQPWPSLSTLIEANARVVMFSTTQNTGAPGWYHSQEDYVLSTNFGAKEEAQLSCDFPKAIEDNSLLLLKHVLANPIALPDLAEVVNTQASLRTRVEACSRGWKRNPNIIQVDFHTIGDWREVVKELNTGRLTPVANP